MKNITHLGKRWLKKSPGFTLAELMATMAIGGFVVTSVLAVWTQLFFVTAANSNYMAAFRQVQNGGDWISRDSLMTQSVYAMPSPTPELRLDITDSQTTIPVDSTDDFPPSGVICIEDEFIQYAAVDYGANDLTGCTRGDNAVSHDEDTPVTFLVALGWTDWSGDHHQVFYNMKQTSRHLMRNYLIKGSSETSYTLLTSTLIAEAIDPDPASTSTQWNYDQKELTMVIIAQVGDKTATRTYKIHPRPLF